MIKFITSKALMSLGLLGASLMHFNSAQAQQNWIVGGHLATEGQLPFVGDLRLDGRYHFCGSALIDARWVITAAHCMEDQGGSGGPASPNSFSVRFNTINTEGPLNNNGGVNAVVEKVIVHQDYDFATTDLSDGNDIALIKLRAPVTSISPIPVAKFVDTSSVYTANKSVLVAGWGLESITPIFSSSDILKYCVTKVFSRSSCQGIFGPLSNNVFCAGFRTGEEESGAGQGDSGGPVWVEENGNKKLIGIVSGGLNELTQENEPGLYTKVAKYQDWIDSVINANGGYLSVDETPVLPQLNVTTSISSNTLQVKFLENIDGPIAVRVYDAIGRAVYQGMWEKPSNGTIQHIPVSSWTNGMYILQLQSTQQSLDYNCKFMIQQ